MKRPDDSSGSWTLLTGHGHVLVEIARTPDARVRDIADAAGITERTAQAIVSDLEAAGYITRRRVGRRTRYSVNPNSMFRHSAQEGLRVGPFLDLLASDRDGHQSPGQSTTEAGNPSGTGVPGSGMLPTA
jgi:DNA-binding transcriptional ArsR family regulator